MSLHIKGPPGYVVVYIALAAIVAFSLGQRCAPDPVDWEAKVVQALTTQRDSFRLVQKGLEQQVREAERHAYEMDSIATYESRRASKLAKLRLSRPPLPDTASAHDSIVHYQGQADAAIQEAEGWRLAYEAADSATKALRSALVSSEVARGKAEDRVVALEGLLESRPRQKGDIVACVAGPGVDALHGTTSYGQVTCGFKIVGFKSPI